MPKTFVAFLGGFAGISDFPPFGIFIGELFIIMGAFRTGHYVSAALFILSICVIFAGFSKHIMKISFGDYDVAVQAEEKPSMVWPQYVLLLTSVVLCFWMPDPLYQTILHAVQTISGGG
jgi:hydrogenase-4 component F